jgi:hypothetical protein
LYYVSDQAKRTNNTNHHDWKKSLQAFEVRRCKCDRADFTTMQRESNQTLTHNQQCQWGKSTSTKYIGDIKEDVTGLQHMEMRHRTHTFFMHNCNNIPKMNIKQ